MSRTTGIGVVGMLVQLTSMVTIYWWREPSIYLWIVGGLGFLVGEFSRSDAYRFPGSLAFAIGAGMNWTAVLLNGGMPAINEREIKRWWIPFNDPYVPWLCDWIWGLASPGDFVIAASLLITFCGYLARPRVVRVEASA